MRERIGETCAVCSRDRSPGKTYCYLHEYALKEVTSGFEDWRRAVSDLTWERYLETIIALKESGAFSREIAKDLLNKQHS